MIAKIPVYLLCYFDPHVLRATLAGLWPNRLNLSVTIIENSSQYSHFIDLVVRSYSPGLISRHYIFESNISNGALVEILKKEPLENHEFVVVSDGDIIPYDADWLKESLSVLNDCEEVFAIGARLDRENLPLTTAPESVGWRGPNWTVHDRYIENIEGCSLWTLRGKDLAELIKHFSTENIFFEDLDAYRYVTSHLNRRWAITKKAYFRHLTWDSYSDTTHPYTQMKMQKTFSEHWRHGRQSSHRLKSNIIRGPLLETYEPWPDISKLTRNKMRKWSAINILVKWRLHGLLKYLRFVRR